MWMKKKVNRQFYTGLIEAPTTNTHVIIAQEEWYVSKQGEIYISEIRHRTYCIGGRPLWNLRFAGDNDGEIIIRTSKFEHKIREFFKILFDFIWKFKTP